ncbi:MAG: hypothetical protein AAF757_31375 [Cyanobacteria bacterium P01_D01_bin.116]
MSERKTYFSAVIERTTGMLNANPKIDTSGYYFKDVRTRNGDLLREYIIPRLKIEDQEKLVNYKTGDYVAFLADVEFKNIECRL